jgi:hypothetical protein
VEDLLLRSFKEIVIMKNPHEHVPYCQTSSAIAGTCPACQWALTRQSRPLPAPSFETKLTEADEQFLTELAISY